MSGIGKCSGGKKKRSQRKGKGSDLSTILGWSRNNALRKQHWRRDLEGSEGTKLMGIWGAGPGGGPSKRRGPKVRIRLLCLGTSKVASAARRD